MNRRTFLAGLASTTAIVAAGGVPAPPVPPRSVEWTGTMRVVGSREAFERIGRKALDLAEPTEIFGRGGPLKFRQPGEAWTPPVEVWPPPSGTSVPQQVAAMETDATRSFRHLVDAITVPPADADAIERDLRHFGSAFYRLPGGERVSPFAIYQLDDQWIRPPLERIEPREALRPDDVTATEVPT